jgi:Na+/glutamate symporter
MLAFSLKSNIISHYLKSYLMAIPIATKAFIDNLINYYISEASSYKQFAQEYTPEIVDVHDATFGIIVGCVYSGFLQAYSLQNQKPSLDEIQEFHQIIKRRAAQIKKGVLDAKI